MNCGKKSVNSNYEVWYMMKADDVFYISSSKIALKKKILRATLLSFLRKLFSYQRIDFAIPISNPLSSASPRRRPMQE